MTEESANHPLEALEGRVDTLLGELREGREQLSALRSRLQALEAERLELREENRELGEQNREMEDHNRDLHARLAAGESGDTSYRLPLRRAQGLSALMGHRPRSARTTKLQVPSAGISPEAPADAATTPPSATPVSAPDSSSPADSALNDAAPRTPPDGPAQGDLEIGDAPTAQALLAEWYQRYDATFFKGHTRPLKVGIHEELAAREPWPEKLVRRALACYVNLPRYLKSVRDGASRIDLNGAPAGTVDEAAAEHAHKKLERLQAQRHKRPAAQGTPGAGKGRPRNVESGKATAGKTESGKSESGKSDSKQPGQLETPSAPTASVRARLSPPATLEEKLSALLAKHNGQDGSNNG